MTHRTLHKILDQIEEDIDDPDVVRNAIATIRCQMAKETPVKLDPEALLGMEFVKGRDYLIFVNAEMVDVDMLSNLPAVDGYGCTFVFVNGPPREAVMQTDRGIFADREIVPEIEGVVMVDGGEIK